MVARVRGGALGEPLPPSLSPHCTLHRARGVRAGAAARGRKTRGNPRNPRRSTRQATPVTLRVTLRVDGCAPGKPVTRRPGPTAQVGRVCIEIFKLSLMSCIIAAMGAYIHLGLTPQSVLSGLACTGHSRTHSRHSTDPLFCLDLTRSETDDRGHYQPGLRCSLPHTRCGARLNEIIG